MSLREGSKVWFVPARGVEEHLGIVLRVGADGATAVLVEGTGTAGRDDRCERVEMNSRMGRVLALTKNTHFYARNIRSMPTSALRVERRRTPTGGEGEEILCPRALLVKLAALADD